MAAPDFPTIKKNQRRRVGVFAPHIFFDINTTFVDNVVPENVIYGSITYTFDTIVPGFYQYRAPFIPPFVEPVPVTVVPTTTNPVNPFKTSGCKEGAKSSCICLNKAGFNTGSGTKSCSGGEWGECDCSAENNN